MSKVPVISAKDFFRWLIKYGCIHISTDGSNYKVEYPKTGKRTTIPIHGNRDIGIPFLKSILGQLGIDAESFIDFVKGN